MQRHPSTSPSLPLRLVAILLVIAACLVFSWQSQHGPTSNHSVEDSSGSSKANSAIAPAGFGLSGPSSTGSREVRGDLIPLDRGTSSFNSYLKQYHSLTNPRSRKRLLEEMISTNGHLFGPQLFELIKSFDPPAEGRGPLLQLGLMSVTEHPEIFDHALKTFDSHTSGKQRQGLLYEALLHYPPEKIGPFLDSMEKSIVDQDLERTAYLIADLHVLGRPQLSDEFLNQLLTPERSSELRQAILAELSERPKRVQASPPQAPSSPR